MLSVLTWIVNAPLNRTRKLSALMGFVKWQLVSRLHKGKLIIDWIDDARLVASNGEVGVTGNIYVGLMEYNDMAFVLSATQSADLFLDVGANSGVYTIMASKLCGARSIAFEPIPSTNKRLVDQVNLNGISQFVKTMNVGVGNTKGKLHFTSVNDATNRVALTGILADTVEVDVIRLDDIIFNHTGTVIVKIDVEGFELNVLRGAEALMRSESTEAVVIEINGSGKLFGNSDLEIHEKILSFGFVPVQFNAENRQISPAVNYNGKGNTIYVKNIAVMQKKCNAAAKRTIHTVGGKII